MAVDQYGRFIRTAPSPRINIPLRESTPSFTYNRRSNTPWYERLWDGFDDVISSIGNFIADKGFSTAEIISGISVWIYAIGLIIWVLEKWSSEGFLWAIVYAFGAVILFGLGCIGLGLFSGLMQLIIAALRYIFWNGMSFVSVLVVTILLIFCSNCSGTKNNEYVSTKTETYSPTYAKYECTAEVLNVRNRPNTTSQVIGTLRKGSQVDVLDTENGFAVIEFNGQRCYVSLKYLSKKY